MKIRNILLINLMVLSFNLIPADEGYPKNQLLSQLVKDNIVDMALQKTEKDHLKKIEGIFKLIQENPNINPEQVKKYLRYLLEMKSHYNDELKINGGENLKIEPFKTRYNEAKKNLQAIEKIINEMSKMQYEGLNIEITIEQLQKESESCVIA